MALDLSSQQLMNSLPTQVVVIDRFGVIQAVNKSWYVAALSAGAAPPHSATVFPILSRATQQKGMRGIRRFAFWRASNRSSTRKAKASRMFIPAIHL